MQFYPVVKIPPVLETALSSPPVRLTRRPSLLVWLALGIGVVFLLLGRDLESVAIGIVGLGIGAWDYLRIFRNYRRQLSPRQVREKQIRWALGSTQTRLEPSDAYVGWLDRRLAQGLSTQKGIEVLTQQKLGPYTPDVIVHVPQVGLWICVEVDEPWHRRPGDPKRYPSHWIGKDERRDQYFLERGWVVIRFAEEQVATGIEGCVGLVMDQVGRVCPRIPERGNAMKLKRIRRWTAEEGLQHRRSWV